MSNRYVNLLVLHCSDTPNGSRKFSARDIDAWHAARGFRRKEEYIRNYNSHFPYAGYHEVIDCDGLITTLRGENEVGAHVQDANEHSIGLCLMGTDSYTPAQWETLKSEVVSYQNRYGPALRVIGHRELNHHKTCPGFDVQLWLQQDMEPMPGHVLGVPSYGI